MATSLETDTKGAESNLIKYVKEASLSPNHGSKSPAVKLDSNDYPEVSPSRDRKHNVKS